MNPLKNRIAQKNDKEAVPLLDAESLREISDDFPLLSLRKTVPSFLRVPFIRTGYRWSWTWFEAAKSLLIPHNETVNVWTHLIGLVIFLWLLFEQLFYCGESDEVPMNLHDHAAMDLLVISCFLLSAVFCFLFSTVFHLFSCVSEEVYFSLYRFDLSGISILIGGSFVPGLFYGFRNLPALRRVYFVLIGLFVAAGLIAPHLSKLSAHYRTALYVSMVVFGLVPAVHWALVVESAALSVCGGRLAGMFALYAIGFAVYWLKVPERFWPGSFDVWGHSHQWWHLFVLAAPLLWFSDIRDYRDLIRAESQMQV